VRTPAIGRDRVKTPATVFLPVNFSHVDSLSGKSIVPICLLAIPRGERDDTASTLCGHPEVPGKVSFASVKAVTGLGEAWVQTVVLTVRSVR
jgi:hypothetical protein